MVNNAMSKLKGKQRLTHPWQWIDWLYLQTSKGKLFSGGWGDADMIDQISKQAGQSAKPALIEPTFSQARSSSNDQDLRCYDYQFLSPVPELPDEIKLARGCLVTPKHTDSIYATPVCISMPGSGEEGYARRIKALAKPLAQQGISTLLLENPFYGSRRRQGQNKYFIATVSDFLLMFYSAVEECKALTNHWLNNGQKQVGLTGLSMGGQAVSLVATQIDRPLAVIPGLAPSSVSEQYSFGYMSTMCDWQALSLNQDNNNKEGEYQARTKLGQLLKIGDITNFPVPNQSICRIINAKNDTYIPLHLSQRFIDHWPHAKVRFINGGHISSILFNQQQIAREITQAILVLPE